MKQGEIDLTAALKRGLRRFSSSPRNSAWLIQCHNLAPVEDGLEEHEAITSLGASGVSWGGGGQYSAISYYLLESGGDTLTDSAGVYLRTKE